MRILISGSHGLVGTALWQTLHAEGHDLLALVRHTPRSDHEIQWLAPEPPNAAAVEGIDAFVHLAGESIAEGRWTPEKKQRIRDSRVLATERLCKMLAGLTVPPGVLVAASAIGYYGNRGDQTVVEHSAAGNDFLARVCVDWEAATAPAVEKGIRVVNARFGVILSKDGGALKKMLPPFQMGVGGRVGSGEQWMSWIALDDVIAIIKFALENPRLQGPVNVVAPNPVTNSEFTSTLGSVLSRPTLFPVPAFAARLLFGEMADALLLSGQRVEPRQLQDAGYQFRLPELRDALKRILQ